jgi:16S rRNA (guanine527-N7)-methyltransferase
LRFRSPPSRSSATFEMRASAGWRRPTRDGPIALWAVSGTAAARVGGGATRFPRLDRRRHSTMVRFPGLSAEMVERLTAGAPRNARPGIASARHNPGGSIGASCRSDPLGCMIGRLAQVAGRPVSRETCELLEHFAELLRQGARSQNLVSRSTLGTLWERHVLDSAQLVRFEPKPGASWADVGSGAGLPGIVIAILVDGPVTLIEPRRLRAEFLRNAVHKLGLNHVTVLESRAERAQGLFGVITARAVAQLDRLLEISTHLSTRNTLWVLPKGRSAESELAQARQNWHCEATVVPSRTDPDSEILLVRHVKARGGR